MIENLDRCADTVILTRNGRSIDDLVAAAHPRFAACDRIEYRSSWFGAVPRMFVGTGVSALAVIAVFLASVSRCSCRCSRKC